MENRDDELSAAERDAFDRLERTIAIDPAEEERTVRSLVRDGLLTADANSSRRDRTRRLGWSTAFAIAAGIVCFVAGAWTEHAGLWSPRILQAATLARAPMMGIGVACDQCELTDSAGSTTWSFRSPPVVAEIWEGGPAAEAGLRVGDTLIAIDGVSLTTASAGERLGRLAAGEQVQLSYRRGHAGSATFTLARWSMGDSDESDPLRFSGAVGANEIEVRGDRAHVKAPDATGMLEIRGTNLTVTVRPAAREARRRS